MDGRLYCTYVTPYCTILCTVVVIVYPSFMLLCNVHLISIIFSHVCQPNVTVSYCVVMQNRWTRKKNFSLVEDVQKGFCLLGLQCFVPRTNTLKCHVPLPRDGPTNHPTISNHPSIQSSNHPAIQQTGHHPTIQPFFHSALQQSNHPAILNADLSHIQKLLHTAFPNKYYLTLKCSTFQFII